MTPFHLVHGVESVLPIECQIPALHITIELLPDTFPLEKRLLSLEQADEDRRATLQNIEAAKNRSEANYDKHVHLELSTKGTLSSPTTKPTKKLVKESLSPCGKALTL